MAHLKYDGEGSLMPSKGTGFNFLAESGKGSDWKGMVFKLWENYLVAVLGWPKDKALPRIKDEVSAQPHAQLLNALESKGWRFEHKVVLDIGCGTGALVSQLAKRSAYVIGMEPGHSFRQAAALRLIALNLNHHAHIIGGKGNQIPVKDGIVDYIFCLQVLEHVHKPCQIIEEIARVLKPGGRAYITFENYLSFFEPHYRVRWLPLLPKPLGGLYLRLIGRDPYFLYKHIHYIVGFKIFAMCYRAKLLPTSWRQVLEKLMHPDLIQRPTFRMGVKALHWLVPARLLWIFALIYSEIRRTFTTTLVLNLEKSVRNKHDYEKEKK